VTSDPVLLSAEDLRSLNLADNYIDGAMDPTDELVLAREVLGLLVAGVLDVSSASGVGWAIWQPEKGWQPLLDARPDLARYLAALEALPQEDSR